MGQPTWKDAVEEMAKMDKNYKEAGIADAALISAIPGMLGAGALGAGAAAASNKLNDTVNVNGEAYIPGKNTVNAIKELFNKKIDSHKMNMLLVDLVAGGLSSTEAKEIADSGYISAEMLNKLDDNGMDALADYLGIPSKEIRERLANLTDKDIDDSTGNNNDPKRDPEEKAKAAAKAEALKKARDKYKNWSQKEKDFSAVNDRLSKAKEGRSNWGKTIKSNLPNTKEASKKLSNDTSRFSHAEFIEKDSPQLLTQDATAKMEQGQKAIDEAMKNGTFDEWAYNHIRPLKNITK